jgi:glycosyltransferase involved in cell wall biosynthesis
MISQASPKISVIMPVYNAERYLRASIDSILRQTYEDFEFIIVNDGSTDGSQEIIDHYASIDNRIIAVQQENKGVVATANHAISLARGEYISRTDADDISFEHKLEDLLHCATKHPKAIVICGSIEVIDERSEYAYRDLVPVRDIDIRNAFYLRNPVPNGATLIKKSAFEKVGGYEDVFAEDCHMWIKLLQIGEFAGTGTAVYRWRMNPTGLTLSNNAMSIEKCKEYIEEHWRFASPTYMTRGEILKASSLYIAQSKMYGIEYKKIFMSDLSRLSIHLIKRGHVTQGLRQLVCLASTGRTGLKIALRRLHLVSQGHFNKLRKLTDFGRNEAI